jgi:hypothetical protein
MTREYIEYLYNVIKCLLDEIADLKDAQAATIEQYNEQQLRACQAEARAKKLLAACETFVSAQAHYFPDCVCMRCRAYRKAEAILEAAKESDE